MTTNFVYKEIRPRLTIEFIGGEILGNCYTSTSYKIISRFKLSEIQIKKLRETNIMGFGQEFYIKSICNGSEKPEIFDEVPCVEIDSVGNIINLNPINQYSGKPYSNTKLEYYVYNVEDRCDSSD